VLVTSSILALQAAYALNLHFIATSATTCTGKAESRAPYSMFHTP